MEHPHWLFVFNVGAHWVASMSSIVSFTLGIVELFRDRKTEAWIFWSIAFLFLVMAFDQAWQDEHRNSQVLTGEKMQAVVDANFWKDQSYQKDSSLRTRDELLSQNFSALTSTQAALANLSNKLLDALKQEKLRVKPLYLGSLLQNYDAKRSKFTASYVVLTNRAITPVLVTVKCKSPIVAAAATILGGTTFTGGSGRGRLDDYTYELSLGSPAWTPSDPLIVTVWTNEQKVDCDIEKK
jgi:hypothetical protein